MDDDEGSQLVDGGPALVIVVTESPAGVQDARACCDACYASVLRYVGLADEGR